MSEATTIERVPCHEFVNVIEQRTRYKTKEWWCAMVLGEKAGKKFVAMYLWKLEEGKWKQKGTFKLNSKSDWTETKSLVDELVQKL